MLDLQKDSSSLSVHRRVGHFLFRLTLKDMSYLLLGHVRSPLQFLNAVFTAKILLLELLARCLQVTIFQKASSSSCPAAALFSFMAQA